MDIVLADDHTLVRDGLRPFLEELDDNVLVIEAENLEHALRAGASAHDLRLIILDLGMPGMDTLKGVRKMMETYPATPVVILSGTHDQGLILKAFNMGVAGFIPKSAGSNVMMSALKLVIAGERFIPAHILAGAGNELAADLAHGIYADNTAKINETDRLQKLSKRERSVLELLVNGMTNKEIARAIDLQEATIKIHVKNIYRKMGVANRAQAVRSAIEPDWHTPQPLPTSH